MPVSKNRIILIVSSLIVLSIIIIVGVALLRRPSAEKLQVSPTPIQTFPEERNNSSSRQSSTKLETRIPQKNGLLEVSKNVLKWLDKTRTPNGVYSFGTFCKGDSDTCNSSIPEGRVGLGAIWGRFKYYEATQDPVDLAIITKDLFTYADKSQVKTIQNDFWNCKFMNDMVNSPLINSAAKIKAKQICTRGQYYNADLLKFDEMPTAVEIDVDRIIAGESFQPDFPIENGKLSEYPAFASDLVYKYLIEGQQNIHYKYAVLMFNRATQSYTTDPELLPINEILYGIAAFDMSILTGNSKYVELSEKIFDKRSRSIECTQLESCTMRAYWANTLLKATNNDSYRVHRDILIGELLRKSYDTQGKEGFKKGLNAFRTLNDNNFSYLTRYNGILAGLLATIKQ